MNKQANKKLIKNVHLITNWALIVLVMIVKCNKLLCHLNKCKCNYSILSVLKKVLKTCSKQIVII